MNKKIIAISLLVIVSAISISGCLGPNEDELYNEKMTEIYNDMQIMNETLTETESTQTIVNSADNNNMEEIDDAIDNVTSIIDNDTQKLKDLNEQISNTTRKEYIGICVNELNKTKEEFNILKDVITLIKDYNDKKISASEVQTNFTKLEPKLKKIDEELQILDKKRLDYEKKHTCVLINGTVSAWGNDTMNTTMTN